MLGDLMNKVKGLKKKGGGGDDDTAEFEMGDDVLDELEEDLDDIDDDFDEDTGEINPKFDAANQKKIKMAGIIVVLLLGGYFAVDEFVLKNQDDVALAPPPLKKRPRPKKKKPKQDKQKEVAKTEKKEAAPVPTPDTMADAMANAEPPKMDTSTNDLPSEPSQMDTPTNDPMDSLGSNEPSMNDTSGSSDSSSGDLDFASSGSGSTDGSGGGSGSFDGEGTGTGDGSGEGSGDGLSTGSGIGDSDSGSGAVGSSSGTGQATEVDTPIEYVSPPNYEVLGRGLVYNCIKQHWACVDKANFFQCSKNAKWFASQSKGSECMTDAVFATIEDCNSGQLQRINNNFVPAECFQPE